MMTSRKQTLSIVVPVYNEQDVLGEFHLRLVTVLSQIPMQAEIIYTNDGSDDESLAVLHKLRKQDSSIAIIDLSRNFGKEIALTAGLHQANGDAIVVIDADLQDPPELIPELIKSWQQGADVVYAKRRQRNGETITKRLTAYLFYRVMKRIGKTRLPEDTGDFRLLSRRSVDALNRLGEHHRFMKGLFTWIGFKQKAVYYDREQRYAGTSKWNYWKLWNFALEGITSFTTAPLKLASYFGMLTAFCSFIYALHIIIKTIFFGNPTPGYPSLVVIILFIGGVQLMAIGILGEYVGRIFTETKHRPLYFINDYYPARDEPGQDEKKSIENIVYSVSEN